MSKLITRLNRTIKAAPEPMGFRITPATSAKPKLVLIAAWSESDDVDRLMDYAAGADAVLLRFESGNVSARTWQKIAKSLPDMPWGVYLGEIGTDIKALEKAGCDFFVFPTSAALTILPEDTSLGKVLQVETLLNEGLLRTAGDLPIDAVFIAGEDSGNPITWQRLMLLYRLADLLDMPLLVSVPAGVTAGELQLVLDSGVDGIVVPVSTQAPAGKIAELRRTTDELSMKARKRSKLEPLVPRMREEAGPISGEEEEPEEE